MPPTELDDRIVAAATAAEDATDQEETDRLARAAYWSSELRAEARLLEISAPAEAAALYLRAYQVLDQAGAPARPRAKLGRPYSAEGPLDDEIKVRIASADAASLRRIASERGTTIGALVRSFVRLLGQHNPKEGQP